MRYLRRGLGPVGPTVDIPPVPGGVVQVCHPDWRGVRASAIAFGDPIIEATNLDDLGERLEDIDASGARTIVIQGWPPGAEAFARSAAAAGFTVLAVSHSAPSQHGVDAGEAEALTAALALADAGVIDAVGTVKAGVARTLERIGIPIVHVPNRVPVVADVVGADRYDGTNAGVFLHPMWRKNVVTQVLAARSLGWTVHVMDRPSVGYLPDEGLVTHGELPRTRFLPVLASMSINLNVTLSECHPMMPMESYRLGVPCLVSRTSDLFSQDDELWGLTTVSESDNPDAVARSAAHLLDNRDEAVHLANRVLDDIDRSAGEAWSRFTGRATN